MCKLPIEDKVGAFYKIKCILRKAQARTGEALVEAMAKAPYAVTVSDVRGFFEHCGYRTVVQPF